MRIRHGLLLATLALLLAAPAAAQPKLDQKVARAEREYDRGRAPRAEKLVREVLAENPKHFRAQRLLGDVLMLQRRYTAAAMEYSKARQLAAAEELTEGDRRRLTDQLGVAYGMAGQLESAEQVYKAAIAEDPDYAIFHYHLACTYAEQGRLEEAIEALQEAWSRRKNLLRGERFPDPRRDPSFAPYLNDPQFQEGIREMVF